MLLVPALMGGCRGPLDGYDPGLPPSPGRLWDPGKSPAHADPIARLRLAGSRNEDHSPDQLAADRTYTLPELIDYAQRNHPETRVAWEHARAAAAGLGLVESAYLPSLTLSAAAGYEHLFLPFPDVPSAGLDDGYVTADTVVVTPTLRLNWVLFDFGRREHLRDAARERVVEANFGFNAAHQRIVFDVTATYYGYIDAREQVGVAESEVESARTLSEAVEARLKQGLATTPETLEAKRLAIEATYRRELALSHESNARVALAEAVGVLPTTRFGVAEVSRDVPNEDMLEAIDAVIDRALTHRPDLAAMLADVRAREAELRAAESSRNPVFALTGSVSLPYESLNVEDSGYLDAIEPRYGVGVALTFPLYDSGRRSHLVSRASAALAAAESEFRLARDAAVREVWNAYTASRLALRRKPVADALLDASEASYQASLEAYRNGVGDYVQVAEAQRNLTAARAIELDTRTAIHTSLAALSRATGDLASPGTPAENAPRTSLPQTTPP